MVQVSEAGVKQNILDDVEKIIAGFFWRYHTGEEPLIVTANGYLTRQEMQSVSRESGSQVNRLLQQKNTRRGDLLKTQIADTFEQGIRKHISLSDTAPIAISQQYTADLSRWIAKTLPPLYNSIDRIIIQDEKPRDTAKQILEHISGRVSGWLGAARLYQERIETHDVLSVQDASGVSLFRFHAESGENTCQTCEEHDGETFTRDELASKGLIPPLHKNCRCKLEMVDGAEVRAGSEALAVDAEAQHRAALKEFENLWRRKNAGETDPTIDAAIAKLLVSELTLSEATEVVESIAPGRSTMERLRMLTQPELKTELEQSWYDPLLRIPDDAKKFWNEMVGEQSERFESIRNPVDFLNWLTYGYLDANQQRGSAMTEDPNLYTVGDWLTSGSFDMAKGALDAEEPLSLEHWINSLGVAGLLFGAYKTGQHNIDISKPGYAVEKAQKTNVKADERWGGVDARKSDVITKEVEFVDAKGKPLGEFDEIDLTNKIFYEDKTAKGLSTINPRTGLPTQTAQEFADKQILVKTRNRINNLSEAVGTREAKTHSVDVPNLDQLKGIKEFRFRLDGDTLELRIAVENSLNQLKKEFPEYKFSVEYGVGGN